MLWSNDGFETEINNRIILIKNELPKDKWD